jgi:transglutaminase-like putative cysteine protease
MRLSVRAELVYSFAEATQVMALIEASCSTDQDIVSESLDLDPASSLVRDTALSGDRRFRACLSGEVGIVYSATVENRVRQLLPAVGRQHLWADLPEHTLPFLLPSRFCPSDKFMRFAAREFGAAGDGVAKVMAVLEWITRNVDYLHGISTPETTAERTFVDRAGVCRDFTHLAITLCRALSIPARAVSAYALGLEPPDFHAIFEVYLEGGWWLVDPTRLAPIEGIVRIGSGRDAADIAFLTTEKPCQLVRQSVAVTRAGSSQS